MTTREAAYFLGYVNESRIRQLILAGDIKATKPGRDWVVDEQSVREYGETMKIRLPNPKRNKK